VGTSAGETLLRPVYGAAVRLLQAIALVAPAGESKIARALRARRGLLQSYEDWGKHQRDRARPLLWVHAPSVGEGLQVQPVVAFVRERRPDVQIAYTFFSPSAEPFAANIAADFRAYLPFDHPRDAAVALDALSPSALVFCRADIWPNLVDGAATRRIPIGLISATVPARSARLRAPAATLLRAAFGSLDRVGAVDREDADRLQQLTVPSERITVTGDTRFDQVWARASRDPTGVVQQLSSDRPTIVAGSTWPSDEEVLLRVVRAIRRVEPLLRLIIAPHEITSSRMAALEPQLRAGGALLSRLSTDGLQDADVILVDTYGVLGDVYRLADIAFVGGGFHRAGLHSVLEPAAFGAPVIFGPHHTRSRDAQLLLAAGGARGVPTRLALERALMEWLNDDRTRRGAGTAARTVVEQGLGAAERSYELVTELLDRGTARER
jgi:3-deoxy-D-manno-octulosonic-acid transferase